MYTQEASILVAVIITCFVILILLGYFLHRINRYNRKNAREKAARFNREIELLEQERTRIAQDLHDSVSGMLSAVKLKLNVGEKQNLPITPLLEEAENDITDVLKQIRRVSHNLMPDLLIKAGITTATEELVKKYDGTLRIEFKSYATVNFTDSQAIHIYRMIEEIIQNTIKHARAKSLKIAFMVTDKSFRIITRDNGIGMKVNEVSASSSGIGWRSLHNRAHILDATLNFHSRPNEGVEVVIDIPLPGTMPAEKSYFSLK